MSWSGAITALEGHAATLNFSVRSGESIPQKKTVAWYFTGTGDNELIPETLTDHPYADLIEVRFYWPVATRAAVPSATLEHEVRNAARSFIALIEGDRTLGGNAQVVTIGDTTAGWLDLDGAAFRVVTVPLSLGQTDIEPISP